MYFGVFEELHIFPGPHAIYGGSQQKFLTQLYNLYSKYSASDTMSCKHVIGFVRNKLVDII
jgi:hypothetical protein